MMRRVLSGFGIIALIGVAIVGAMDSSVPAVDAQTSIDELEAGAREDFLEILATQQPTAEEGAVGLQAIQGNSELAPFPHTALYGGPNSSGWPLVGVIGDSRPGWSEPLNESVMNAYARFPHLIIPIMPAADMRPDILTSLRQRNSTIRVHAYIHGGAIWCPEDGSGNNSYPPNTSYRANYLAVTGGDQSCGSTSDRFLWMQDGIKADQPPHNMGININIAHRVQNPDSSYTYDVAEDLAGAMYEYGRAGRNWNGIFLDVFCPQILWMETPGHLFDYARAGYGSDNSILANRTAFDVGWQAGHQRLVERLRELAIADGQSDYPISGNCGQAPDRLHPVMNGWMRENYPFQNGYAGYADFYSNNLAWPWGLLHQDRNFRNPQYNYIFTAANWSGGQTNNPGDEQYNSTNQRKVRFGLGSAAMGNGWHAFHHGSGDPAQGHWYNWWYDEYGVNTLVPRSDSQWGRSLNGPAYTGWLGQPTTPPQAALATTYASTSDLLTAHQGFESGSGSDLTGWIEFVNPGGNSVTHDQTTAAVGSASARMTVVTPGAGPVINIFNGAFPVTANATYTVTFWAKASAPLPIQIALGAGTLNAVQTIPVDETWRQYQALVRSTLTAGSTAVLIGAGMQIGTYWVDDVHVQPAATAVWRRDFDKGIVLVNPTPVTLTVNLEKPYRKILGTVNPSLNDGSQVSSVTLAGTSSGGGVGDAIFLLDLDLTAPGAISDLRAP